MTNADHEGRPGGRDGRAEIREALSASRSLVVSIALFSAFVNVLMLTGPLFMLQLYDRVLTSRSEATLLALVGIAAFLFLMMGLLDHARGRVLARIGSRFQDRLDARVLGAMLTRAGGSPRARTEPATGLRDVEAMQSASPRDRGRSRSSTRRGRRCSWRCCSCSTGCSGCWR